MVVVDRRLLGQLTHSLSPFLVLKYQGGSRLDLLGFLLGYLKLEAVARIVEEWNLAVDIDFEELPLVGDFDIEDLPLVEDIDIEGFALVEDIDIEDFLVVEDFAAGYWLLAERMIEKSSLWMRK